MKLPHRTVCGISAILVAAALATPSLAADATAEVRTDEIPIYPELVTSNKHEDSRAKQKTAQQNEPQNLSKPEAKLVSSAVKSQVPPGRSGTREKPATDAVKQIASKTTVKTKVINTSSVKDHSVAHAGKAAGKPGFSGVADYYADMFHGKKTASGQIHDKNKMTAAHRTLPFGTKLRITNRKTGKSCCVVINDRGPYTPNRIIDLSYAAAKELGLIRSGSRTVDCAVVADSPDGSQTE